MNQVLILKKIAILFVTLATGKEPENEDELCRVCSDWHKDLLYQAPKINNLKLLLSLAYRIVNSTSIGSDRIPSISYIIDEIKAVADLETPDTKILI